MIKNHTSCDLSTIISAAAAAGLPSIDSMDLTIQWSGRMRTAAGRCTYYPRSGEVVIDLNADLFSKRSAEENRNTVSHEIAHALCQVWKLGEGHDARWARIHRQLGGTGERCHKDGNLCQHNLKRRVAVKDVRIGRVYFVTPNKARKVLSIVQFDHKMVQSRPFKKVGALVLDQDRKVIRWQERSEEVVATMALDMLHAKYRSSFRVVG